MKSPYLLGLFLVSLAIVWVPVTASAGADPDIKLGNAPSLGPVITDPNGMTLYVFTRDSVGVSNCNGGCAATWPPLTVPAGTTPSAPPDLNAGGLGTLIRADGSTQVTLSGRPLYHYSGDQKPGDALGQGLFGGIWLALNATGGSYPLAATPTAAAAPTTASTPSAPSTGSGVVASGPDRAPVAWLGFALLLGALALGGAGIAARRRG